MVDWGSEIKIEDEIGLKDPRVIHKYVPRSVTNQFQTPFSEVHSLNYAARISCADFIGRLDQDTMIGDRFAQWFFEGVSPRELGNQSKLIRLLLYYFKKRPSLHSFYFCKRTDLRPGVIDPGGESSPNAPLDYEPWKCAVGIFLVPTQFWHESTGYDEKNIHFNHMEHEFIFRLKKKIELVDLSKMLNYDFYHLDHSRHVQDRVYNEMLGEESLKSLSYVANDPHKWGLLEFGIS